MLAVAPGFHITDVVATNVQQSMTTTPPAPSVDNTLLPGAGLLPSGIGSKLTLKNAFIAGGLAAGGYLLYVLLFKSRKKSAPPPVAGLFRRKRRR